MPSLTREERDKSIEHITRCDRLFDGKREDGTQSTLPPDKEFAYLMLRSFALELLEKLTEGLCEHEGCTLTGRHVHG